jgi:hypothetical protein
MKKTYASRLQTTSGFDRAGELNNALPCEFNKTHFFDRVLVIRSLLLSNNE